MTPRQKKSARRFGITLLATFILLNIVAAFHAWSFTHFSANGVRHENPATLTWPRKIGMLLTGVKNPRPIAHRVPDRPYAKVTIQSNVKLNAWYINATGASKGTVILCHGYGGEKSSMLAKAYHFLERGYNVLLPDFMGAGASEGNTCTIGFKEARNVGDCVRYVADQFGEKKIILMGTSMGAAAILKYLHDGAEQPAGIIMECPFGTMYETVCARFKMVNVPQFPLAALLVFWGGLENGFWAFRHNPETYATSVTCPALLLFGELDDRVSRKEIDAIFHNLGGPKTLQTFPHAGHNGGYETDKDQWEASVDALLRCTR